MLLVGYTWIFNLAENIVGYDDLEYKIAHGMEDLGLHFTGSSAANLKTCLDKSKTKAILLQHGLLTPAYSVFHPGEAVDTELTFPLFVKPLEVDGSVGIAAYSLVQTLAELDAKVKEIHHMYRQAALVEEYIEGQDISAAVLGNGTELQVLPLSEIVYQPAFAGPRVLTYKASWMAGSAAYTKSGAICPYSLSNRMRDLIISMARSSYYALGCRDHARIDFRLQGDTPYVFEVKPKPCLHPGGSDFVLSSQTAGLDFSTTIYQILENSMHLGQPCAAQREK